MLSKTLNLKCSIKILIADKFDYNNLKLIRYRNYPKIRSYFTIRKEVIEIDLPMTITL